MAKKAPSASKSISRIALTESKKELASLKDQIKSMPSGSAKNAKIKEAQKLAAEIDQLASAAR